MNKYQIDYGYGIAAFWTEADDWATVKRAFSNCANSCFGIRKSISKVELIRKHTNVELALRFRGHGATHALSHSGDEILFDANFTQDDVYPWKLFSEYGDWCSCVERGKPELTCDVHHHYVTNHDELCDCMRKAR